MGMDVGHPTSIPGGVNGVLLPRTCFQIAGRHYYIVVDGGEVDALVQTCSRHFGLPSQLVDLVFNVTENMLDIPFLAKSNQEIRDRLSLFDCRDE